MTRGKYFIQYYFLNDTSRYCRSLKVEVIWALIAVVVVAEVVVVVVVVAKVVAEIISILVAVGRGGDYLDTSSGSSSRDYFQEISCSESVLWTTNCPLVLACNGLGDSGHFLRSLYTF
jgi:hypothetical protein